MRKRRRTNVPAPDLGAIRRRKTRRQLERENNPNRRTRRELAGDSPVFRKACELAGVEPTARQYAKFTRKRGQAWSQRNGALAALDEALAALNNTQEENQDD